MKATGTLIVMLIFLSGCSSCERGEETSRGGGGAAPTATAVALRPAAGTPGKIQVVPLVPTVGAAPRPPAQGGAPAAPGGGAPGAPEAEEEGDCIVIADANPDYGPPPLAVAFSAEAECSAGQPTHRWDFGDGSPGSAEVNPSHTYTKPGEYTATVTVTAAGVTATDEIDITVEEGEPEGE